MRRSVPIRITVLREIVMKTSQSLLFEALLIATLLALAGPAAATPLPQATFDLTSDDCTGGCLTGQTNGGVITVTDNGSGSLSFDVTLANGNEFVNTGAGAAL